MLQEFFDFTVQKIGSQTSAVALLAGLVLGLLLMMASILNPESRTVRWFKALGIIAIVLALFGSWRVKEPELASVRAIAGEVPVLEGKVVASTSRINELESANASLSTENKILKEQVGHQKAEAAEALASLQKQMKNIADSLGAFDHTNEGVARLTLPGDLLFDAGSATLDCRQKEALAKLIGYLLLETNLPFKDRLKAIVVLGHTDNTPKARSDRVVYNQQLSDARANAVADYLMEQGIKVPIKRIGKGMMVPKKASHDTTQLSLAQVDQLNQQESDRRDNRRVELLFVRGADEIPK